MGNLRKQAAKASEPVKVVLFTSRNKDNKDKINGFRERTMNFVTTADDKYLASQFDAFVANGLDGELCRWYESVNLRDNSKIQHQLIHDLIDQQYSMATLQAKVASIASHSSMSITKHWMFDFDPIEDREGETDKLVELFVQDIFSYMKTQEEEQEKTFDKTIDVHKTVNGYAVITRQGFDTRDLLAKWPNVELKRDGMLLVDYKRKDC